MNGDPSQKKDDSLGIVFNAPAKEATPKVAESTPTQNVTPVKHVEKATAPTSHLGDQGVFDVGRAITSEQGETGTIVSDRRHSRPSIGESLASAWGEWLGRTKANVEKLIESRPQIVTKEPEVAKAETRAEVIAQAAAHATIAPKDDHHVVVEKLRTMGSDTERITGSPVTISPPKQDTTKGSWSHYEEKKVLEKKPVSTPDLRKTAIAPDLTKKIAPTSFTPPVEKRNDSSVTTHPKSIPPQIITVPHGFQKKRSSILESAVHISPRVQRDTDPTYSTPIPRPQLGRAPLAKHEATHITPEPPRVPTPIAQTNTPKTIVKPNVVTPPQKQTLPPAPRVAPTADVQKRSATDERPVFHGSHSDWSLQELSPTHAHTTIPTVPRETRTSSPSPRYTSLTWMVLGGIVILGIVLAVGASVYMNLFRESKIQPAPNPETPLEQPLLEESGVEVVTITEDARASLTSLGDTVSRAKQGRTEIRLAILQDGAMRSARAEELLTAIGAGVDPSALRAFDDSFTAGSITTTENVPYFVFRTTRFDALFVGLLGWEDTLYADLTPLFGVNEITHSQYKDVIVGGKPVRVLTNDAGLDVVAYGFLNQNTVVITKSRDALLKLFLEL